MLHVGWAKMVINQRCFTLTMITLESCASFSECVVYIFPSQHALRHESLQEQSMTVMHRRHLLISLPAMRHQPAITSAKQMTFCAPSNYKTNCPRLTSHRPHMPLSPKLHLQPTRTENTQAYSIPSSYRDYHRNSFFPRTVRAWNILPQEVIQLSTAESFKNAILST